MKNKLKNKVAIITGASSGIGLAIAKLLFKNGVKIYNISRATFEADEIIKSYECDVNNTEKIKEIVESIFLSIMPALELLAQLKMLRKKISINLWTPTCQLSSPFLLLSFHILKKAKEI